MIIITRREQVAQIQGRPIYAVRDVSIIPLSSQDEAEKAITAARTQVTDKGAVTGETGDSDDDEEIEASSQDHEELQADIEALEPPASVLQKSTTFVKDVVRDQGKYGRFAERWFSKTGWNTSGRRSQGMTSENGLTKEQEMQAAEALPVEERKKEAGLEDALETDRSANSTAESDAAVLSKQTSVLESLTPRILRAARLYFSTSGFFFSYEHDLSRSLMGRKDTAASAPLWTRFSKEYFWNCHLQRHFIEAGYDAYILPLLQGFVGQRSFSIASQEGEQKEVVHGVAETAKDMTETREQAASSSSGAETTKKAALLLTLVSRRSTKRAGLRYLRRGIDDQGNVANAVETEQILSSQSSDVSEKTFSLVQIRGSIPLFFSQTPYSFKPHPVLHGSDGTNQTALKTHFDGLVKRYSKVQCVCLIDKHGTESTIGETYERQMQRLNSDGGSEDKSVDFEWFDFHKECKGMRFENVSILLHTLQTSLQAFGWTEKTAHHITQQQGGVLRSNCMDCLDRTNVVQSAIAGWALEQQLAKLGLNIDLKTDPSTQWFNTLWADNGDAISKQYAGTSALKGDFTRTRKRNWAGALTDLSLTLNRYYNNMFGDYFLQLNIDFFLGNVGPSVFDDFEADMVGRDYTLDVQRVRAEAVETCTKLVLADPKEDLLAAWTLSCPHEPNTLAALPFQDCVLLLTDSALYFCRFDWDAEKVGSYERVDLLDVREIWRGAYVTSTLGPTQTDEVRNVGFALRYHTHGHAVVRTNSRTTDNEQEAVNEMKDDDEHDESRLLAFKALPPKSSGAKHDDNDDPTVMSEQELVKHVCSEIYNAMGSAARKQKGIDHLGLDTVPEIQEHAVISAAEARKNTGYVESVAYSLKKLVWS